MESDRDTSLAKLGISHAFPAQVHRGAVLGALLGANAGKAALDAQLIDGLTAKAEIAKEIDTLLAAKEAS